MAEAAPLLARPVLQDLLVERPDVRLVGDPLLSMAKVQVIVDDSDAWFEEVLGIAAPAPLREIEPDPVVCAWLAPGEWLVTGAEEDVARVRDRCAAAAATLGLVTDITHGRAAFELSGQAARTILAAHCPLDLGDAAMPVGAAMRSVFSDTGFFISRRPDVQGQPCFRIIFDQSMAAYAERLLCTTLSGASL